jgi:hypothetical protein
VNNKEATELVRRSPETFATLREYIEKLERENAALKIELNIADRFHKVAVKERDALIKKHNRHSKK